MTRQTPRAARLGVVGAIGAVAGGSMVANVCMYLVHLLASSRFLTPDEYGEFAVLLSAMLVLGVPALALQAVVAREVVRGRSEHRLRVVSAQTTAGVVVITAIAVPVVTLLARTSWLTTLAALAAAPLLTVISEGQGILQGRGEFRALAWLLAVVGVLRAAPVIAVLAAGAGPMGGLAAGTAGTAVAGVAVWAGVRWAGRSATSHMTLADAVDAVGVLRASQVQLVLIVASSVDLLLSRTVLGADDAGVYALGAIATKVAFWLPQAIGVVFYPRLADAASSRASLRQAVGVVAVIGLALTVAAGLAGPLVPLIFGDDYRALVPILWLFAYTGAVLSVLQVVLLSAIARDRTRVALVTWLAVGIEVAVIVWLVGSIVALAGTAAVAVTVAVLATAGLSRGDRRNRHAADPRTG